MRYDISEKTKKRQKRGCGEKENYKPYIRCREIPSKGVTSLITDWKHGRQINLLSQAEAHWYYKLRWDDSVEDIREQYPMNKYQTIKLANELGIQHPRDKKGEYVTMTIDFLVTFANGTEKAYSVKKNRDVLRDDRKVELLRLEMAYWRLQGIPYQIVFDEDLNMDEISNIRLVVDYFDVKDVQTKIDFCKHLVARKLLDVDMSKYVNFSKLASTVSINDMQRLIMEGTNNGKSDSSNGKISSKKWHSISNSISG